MLTLDVDFNRVRADGRVIVPQCCAPEPVEFGAKVLLRDLDEDMEFTGTVTGFSDDQQRAFVTMDWR